jgi:hypothetical protein
MLETDAIISNVRMVVLLPGFRAISVYRASASSSPASLGVGILEVKSKNSLRLFVGACPLQERISQGSVAGSERMDPGPRIMLADDVPRPSRWRYVVVVAAC